MRIQMLCFKCLIQIRIYFITDSRIFISITSFFSEKFDIGYIITLK
jgi:hypothetical protein